MNLEDIAYEHIVFLLASFLFLCFTLLKVLQVRHLRFLKFFHALRQIFEVESEASKGALLALRAGAK